MRDVAERDANRAFVFFQDLGALPVLDYAPTSGGHHVYARVPPGEEFTVDEIRPIMRALQRLYSSLDTQPMTNPKVGCVTVPGSRAKDGGWRELIGADIRDMNERLALGAKPGFLDRLRAALEPQLALDVLIDAGVPDDAADSEPGRATRADALTAISRSGLDLTSTLPLELRSRLSLKRGWVHGFITNGVYPNRQRRDGRSWTASEARQSLLYRMARRGWSGDRAWAALQGWPPVWASYAARSSRQQRELFRSEWSKAFTQAVEHAELQKERTSATTGHKVGPTAHRGGSQNRAKHRLAAAQVWALTHPDIAPQLRRSALLTIQALAHALSVSSSSTATFGVRGLSLACGLPAETVRRTLLRLRDIEGSPVLLVDPTNLPAQSRSHACGQPRAGDAYTLVTPMLDGLPVAASWWEVEAARLDAVDPVWSSVGHPMAWWVWRTMLAIDRGDRSTPLPLRVIAAAARISVDTVDKAVAALAADGLVDRTYGHAVRTGRTVRQLGERTIIADEIHEVRRERYSRERAEFVAFLEIVTSEYGAAAAVLVAAADVIEGVDGDDVDDWHAWLADMDGRAPPERAWCSEQANERSIRLLHEQDRR